MNRRLMLCLSLFACLSTNLAGCTKDDGDDDNDNGGGDSTPTNPADITGQLSQQCTVSKIFGGESCPEALGPVVLLLGVDQNGRSKYGCTGTFLSPRKILTAGHCDPNLAGNGITLVAITQGQLDGPGPVGVAGVRFVRHPLSVGNPRSPYDVGILTLVRDVDAATLPLLVSEDTEVGQSATLYGFGLEENQQPSIANGKLRSPPKLRAWRWRTSDPSRSHSAQ